MKINLGSGENKLLGYVNIDKRPIADIQKDVGKETLTPEIHDVEEVIIHHAAEHFPNFLFWVNDLAKCCLNGCIWKITVPYATWLPSLSNPHHVNPFFTEDTFGFFGDIYKREQPKDFKLEILKTVFTYNENLWGKHQMMEWEKMQRKYFDVVRQMYQEIKVIK